MQYLNVDRPVHRNRYQDVIDLLFSSGVTQTTTIPEGVPKESVSADRIDVDADTSMEGRLYSLVVRVLGLNSSIGRDELLSRSFAELGGDSVKSMKFKTHLGGLNAVATSVSNSVTLHKPLRELAAVLQSNISGSMLSTWNQAKLDTLTFQMDRDSVLPDLQESKFGQYDATAAQDIFLTGATGYVGAHFLASLLSATIGCQWKIRCLVRCEDTADGLHRLWNVLTAQYMLSVDEACWSRVQVVPGSMNQDCFGLDDPAWEELCLPLFTSLRKLHSGMNIRRHVSTSLVLQQSCACVQHPDLERHCTMPRLSAYLAIVARRAVAVPEALMRAFRLVSMQQPPGSCSRRAIRSRSGSVRSWYRELRSTVFGASQSVSTESDTSRLAPAQELRTRMAGFTNSSLAWRRRE